jgi:uncharacterized protein (TIGR02145 family)
MKPRKVVALYFFISIVSTFIFISGCEKKEDNLITDIDGNKYHTVTIGNQIWMVENLRTTRYSNGDTILEVIDPNQWSKLTIAACCYYHDYAYLILQNHDIYQTIQTYGRLYNWYAVTDNRKIAPMGWHVATVDDWNTLINYAGGKDVAAGKLKEIGTKHWGTPDDKATNDYGFTALPGGICDIWGAFRDITSHGYWWTTSESDEKNAYTFLNYCFMGGVGWNQSLNSGLLGPQAYSKKSGLSVRCVKD